MGSNLDKGEQRLISKQGLMRIRWTDGIRNEDVWERTQQVPVETEIGRRKLKCIGHILRKPVNNIAKNNLD